MGCKCGSANALECGNPEAGGERRPIITIKRGFGRRWVGRAGRPCGGGLGGHPWVFEIRNDKNWHDVLVVSAASYDMEISIANFYPSDDEP